MVFQNVETRDHEVGERVARQIVIGEPAMRYGTITDVYKEARGSYFQTSMTMYEVRWDDTGRLERGYFTQGLKRIRG